ncbi:cation:proton antiporter [Streptomyces noursei]|uniref:cation:proton antiporter domain-containing protein n=1 Tax=Streptomyces noursei TaxID=1971 RepID=UPI0023B7BE49|nr:cation:proton antiporter [Streptomyces noursei]
MLVVGGLLVGLLPWLRSVHVAPEVISVSWAGTRGVMPLAAALSIPLAADDGSPLPHRPLVLVLTTGVVVFTLVLRGFTLAPVVRWSGIALEPEHTAREEARARAGLAKISDTTRRRLQRSLDLEEAGLGED